MDFADSVQRQILTFYWRLTNVCSEPLVYWIIFMAKKDSIARVLYLNQLEIFLFGTFRCVAFSVKFISFWLFYQASKFTKMEKVDILDMTVQFLKRRCFGRHHGALFHYVIALFNHIYFQPIEMLLSGKIFLFT